MNQHAPVKMMDTSDLPTSVVVVLYLSIQYFTSRSLQEFYNKISHSVADQFLLWLFHIFWLAGNQSVLFFCTSHLGLAEVYTK
jgi:hypothetical protein